MATSMVLLRGIASEHIAMPRALARDVCGGWWMVSDYVQGAPLGAGPVHPRRACEEALGVARALAAIHARGTHHGDVSAANVVAVERGGGVRLIDFGCLGQRGTGTPGFLAPEVLAGQGGVAGDWYGLGALLCLRLAGEVPWKRPERAAVYSVDDVRVRLEALQGLKLDSWPRGLFALVADLLDPRAQARAVAGAKASARLQRIIEGDPTTASEAGAWAMPAHIPWLGDSLGVALGVLGEAAQGTIIAVAGPPGAGRGRAARELALQHEGRTMAEVRWLGAHENLPTSPPAMARHVARVRRDWLAPRARGDALVVTCFETCDEVDAAEVARSLSESAALARGALVVVASPALGEALARLEKSEVHVHVLKPVDKASVVALVEGVKVGARDAGEWAEALLSATGGWAGDLVTSLMRAAALDLRSPKDPQVSALAQVKHPPLSTALAREVLGFEWGDPAARVPTHLCEGDRVVGWAHRAAREQLGEGARQAMAREALRLMATEVTPPTTKKGRLASLAAALDANDPAAIVTYGLAHAREDGYVGAQLMRWIVARGGAGLPDGLIEACAEQCIRDGDVADAVRLSEGREALAVILARAVQRQGRHGEAVEILTHAASQTDPKSAMWRRATALRWRLAAGDDTHGVHVDGVRSTLAGFSAGPGQGDTKEGLRLATSELFLWGAFVALMAGEDADAAMWLRRSRAWVDGMGGARALGVDARALQLQATAAVQSGALTEAVWLLEQAGAAFEVAGEREGLRAIDGTLASLAWAVGAPVRALDRGRRAFGEAYGVGDLEASATILLGLWRPLVALGHSGEARRWVEVLSAACERQGVEVALLRTQAVQLYLDAAQGTGVSAQTWISLAHAHQRASMGGEAAALAIEAARASRGFDVPSPAHREALALAREWVGDAPDVELAWALGLEEAAALGPDEGPSVLDARALPDVSGLWTSGRRMLAVEVMLAQASLAARWGATSVAKARWGTGRDYLEGCMKELTKQERDTMVAHLQRRAGIDESLERAFGAELEPVPPTDTGRHVSGSGHEGGAAPTTGVRPARVEHLESLLRSYRRLSREDELPRVLEQVVEAMMELTDAERGTAVVKKADGESIEVSREIEGERGAKAYSASIMRRVMETGEPVLSVDAASDARFEAAGSVAHLNLRSVLAVPLSFRGRVMGAVYVDHRLRRGAFTTDDLAEVEEFASLAALSVAHSVSLAHLEDKARQLDETRASLERRLDDSEVEIAGLRARSKTVALGKEEMFHGIIAKSAAMRDVFRLVERVARTDMPVVITGESGTGKELVARALHSVGPRKSGPFVAENCAAVPETLLESILFGHAKGSFTGAHAASPGLFEAADGGVMFLDEIGEMSPAMQVKLLRVLQEGEVRRVGEQRVRSVSTRVLAATHRDLDAMVEAGTFRQDLYYRLCVVRLELPPLRERREDISLLVAHFLERYGATDLKVSAAAVRQLVQYPWPGNVRELENEVQRWVALCDDTVTPRDLSPNIEGCGEGRGLDPDDLRIRSHTEHLERTLIERALARTEGNLTHAAKLLGLSRYGLQKKIKRLDELVQASVRAEGEA